MEKYQKKYLIKSYETDRNGELRLLTLFNLFQDLADQSAESLGIGRSFCLEENKIWVGSYYHIQISKMPNFGDEINLITWPSGSGLLTGIREFQVMQKLDTLIKASSQWVLLDAKTGRLIKLDAYLKPEMAIQERMIQSNFLNPKEPVKIDYIKNFDIRFDDIDINQHVNNSIYPLWASEAVPEEFREKYKIKEIKIAFKKSAQYPDTIRVKTQIIGKTSYQIILNQKEDIVFARVQINWE